MAASDDSPLGDTTEHAARARRGDRRPEGEGEGGSQDGSPASMAVPGGGATDTPESERLANRDQV